MVEVKPKGEYRLETNNEIEQKPKRIIKEKITYEEAKRKAKEASERISWGLKEEKLKEFKRHNKFLLIFVVAPLIFAITTFLIGVLMTAL